MNKSVMEKTYLVRLLRYSKTGFILVILFMLGYMSCLVKKMDMVLFPYNAMFAYGRHTVDSVTVYKLKAGGTDILYTSLPYWKKDFLETSLRVYAHYVQNGQQTYISQYIGEKWDDSKTGVWLKSALTPGKVRADEQLAWYASFAGKKQPPGTQVTLWSLRMAKTSAGGLVPADSSILLSEYVQP